MSNKIITLDELQQRIERYALPDEMTLSQAQQASRIKRDHLEYMFKVYARETGEPPLKSVQKAGFYGSLKTNVITKQQLINLVEWYTKKLEEE